MSIYSFSYFLFAFLGDDICLMAPVHFRCLSFILQHLCILNSILFFTMNGRYIVFAAIKQEEDNGSDSTNVGAIIGGIAGGIGFLILVFIIYKLVQRNRYVHYWY